MTDTKKDKIKEDEIKDRLFQFIPSLTGDLKPDTLILQGKKRSVAPDGTMVEGTSVKLKPNNALQYIIRCNIADYDEAVRGMKRKIKERDAKYGKGKPGSIVEIPLTRKETRVVKGENVTRDVANFGSIPSEYCPKSKEQKLLEKVASLEEQLGGDNAEALKALEKEVKERDNLIESQIEEIKRLKAAAKK